MTKSFAIFALAWLASACQDNVEYRAKPSSLLKPTDVATAERRTLASVWDTIWTYPSSKTKNREGARPRFASAGVDGVVIFDDSLRRFAKLDNNGDLKWTLERDSVGSVPLGGGIAFTVASDGVISILDPQRSRILLVGSDGKVIRSISLTKRQHFTQIAAIDTTTLVAMSINSPALALMSRSGDSLGLVKLPWNGFADLHPLARQGVLANNRTNNWIFAFSYGDGWFAFRGVAARDFVGRYVDYRPFPEVIIQKMGDQTDAGLSEFTPCTACSVAMTDSSVFLLAGGSKRTMQRIVDEFSVANGAYRGSFELPAAAVSIAINNGVYYVITRAAEGSPRRLLALRPHSRAARAATSIPSLTADSPVNAR
jgi:hypothetical protein